MKLIFAQGNPEKRFDTTRHNVGFTVIDAYAAANDAAWSDKAKFHAQIAEITVDGEKVILAKPTTYYNETGVSARAIVDFYNLDPATDVLVVHDELALPFGTIRIRGQGSDAGNNGIKSLNSHIGPDYHRIRIGVANDLRERMDDADFVLGNFSKDEAETVTKLIPDVLSLITDFISGNLSHDTKTL